MDIGIAKLRLYNKSPFLGTVIFNLPVEIITDDAHPVQTLAVDGEKLMVNQKFWDKMSDSQQIGALAHECGHLFLGHIWRRGQREDMAVDPKTGASVPLWNLATDYAVNLIVVELLQVIGTDHNGWPKCLHQGALLDKKYIGMSSEAIYEDLKKNMKQMSKKQQQDLMDKFSAGKCDQSHWKDRSGKDAKKDEANMRELTKQAVENQKSSSQGKLPASLQRLYEELAPKEDWRKVLIDYVQPFNNDYNLQRPDRRFLEDEFVLPDIKDGEKLDWIAIAIDTSGSIGGKEISHFISEVRSILSSFDKVKVKLTFCDAEASPFIELDEFDASKIKVTGGGGTDFVPVFDLIKKDAEQPLALLYFTDLYGNFPSRAPHYDTLWLATTDQKVPFGKVLDYNV